MNKPFSLALSAAWEERFAHRPEMFQDDDEILLLVPEEVPAREILSLVNAGNMERLLRKRLEGSGFFGARFREAPAARSSFPGRPLAGGHPCGSRACAQRAFLRP